MRLPFLLLLLTCAAAALDLTDLEALGVVCPEHHSCRQGAPLGCRCDALCALHDDCCLDAPLGGQGGSSAICQAIHPSWKTRHTPMQKLPQGSKVVATCPPDADPLVSEACSTYPPDWSDPWMQAPLTDSEGTTYANANCALCRGADPERLERWELLLSCPSLGHLGLNASDVYEGLRRRSDGKWAVEWAGLDHVCTPMVGGPPHRGTPLRPCQPDEVGSCPPQWSRASPCPHYAAPVFDARGTVYRNPHCALCNGASLRGLSCRSPEVSLSLLAKSKVFDFRHLFVVPEEERCGPRQSFDPYVKICRNLRCMLPGHVVKGRRCVKADH